MAFHFQDTKKDEIPLLIIAIFKRALETQICFLFHQGSHFKLLILDRDFPVYDLYTDQEVTPVFHLE